MLKSLFSWLDQWPDAYAAGMGVSVALFSGWIGHEIWRRGDLRADNRRSAWVMGVVVGLFLFAGRWPFLLSAVEYNPDESQILAGAITLTKDPVFWRAVDGTTSGPLNFYVLLPLHWLGAPIDYFTARAVGLALVWTALMASYLALRGNYGRRVAALAVAPTVFFFAAVHEWDFIHFSSEHVAMALFAIAAALLGRAAAGGNGHRGALWAGGMVAGLLPWAKLQAGPLGLALALWGGWLALHARREQTRDWGAVVQFLGWVAGPTLACGLIAVMTGQGQAMLQNYFLQNLLYVGEGSSIGQTWRALWEHAAETHLLPLLLGAQLSAIGGATWIVRRRGMADTDWWMGATCTVVAVICVVVPGRGFLHYTLLLVFPLLGWFGAAVARLMNAGPPARWPRLVWVGAIVLGTLLPLGMRALQSPPEVIGHLAYDWRHPRSSLGNVLRLASQPADRLATWGWLPSLHVESALPQGTRLGYSYWSIVSTPVQEYHRQIYLADLKRNEPVFFVDAVGPGSYYFLDRRTQGHESFPALADYIRDRYSLVVDFGPTRLFVRNDQLMRPALVGNALRLAVAAGRDQDRPPLLPIEDPAVPGLPRKQIGGKNVVMMLPPCELSWPLRGIEKEFLFEYGYDPVAYAQPTQGNGTEIAVIFCGANGEETVLFRRLLDPAHVVADQGAQTARVILPENAAGATLKVETAPGAYNDTSWDWAYVTSPRFVRYPHYALPLRFAGSRISR